MRTQRLHKYPVCICTMVVIVIFIFPYSLLFGQTGNTFDLSHMRYSGLDINRFASRRSSLENMCKAIKKFPTAVSKVFLHSPKLDTVYCPVPFAYSTWFKHSMLKIESVTLKLQRRFNISTLHAIHSQASALNLAATAHHNMEALAQSSQYKLIIVRDPWQRLIAAYNDIVIRQHGYKTQCYKFRDSFTRELKFEGFLRCVLHYGKDDPHSLHRLDHKLSPIYTLCSVCSVPYHFIGEYFKSGLHIRNYQIVYFFGEVMMYS